MRRNRDWRDGYSLFKSAARVAPSNFKVHHNAAYFCKGKVACSQPGRADAAQEQEFHYRQSIKHGPMFTNAYINLGWNLIAQERKEEALTVRVILPSSRHSRPQMFQSAIKAYEDYPLRHVDVSQLYKNLGFGFHHVGRTREAVEAWRVCLRCVRCCVHRR